MVTEQDETFRVCKAPEGTFISRWQAIANSFEDWDGVGNIGEWEPNGRAVGFFFTITILS
jgi:hypothetical protein